jgi:4-diphosphocytidyl-2-C-methyl-D-erythritol kinase
MHGITIKAFAKINLTLDVLHQRPDGYHEVEMIMQGIDLHDLVTLTKTNKPGIELICDSPELGAGPENLAYRAAELLWCSIPGSAGVRIDLVKKIPVAAGLGGGSTDAAAVLLGMNRLFNLGLTHNQVAGLAAELGSDVPFCLEPLTALARGRGEVLEPLAACPLIWMVLIKPPFGVSTKEVYGHFHRVSVKQRPDLKKVVSLLAGQKANQLLDNLVNVLEYATFDLHPQLSKWAQELKEIGADKVLMSGSGPTLLGFCRQREAAGKIAALWNRPGWFTQLTRTTRPEDLEGRMNIDE